MDEKTLQTLVDAEPRKNTDRRDRLVADVQAMSQAVEDDGVKREEMFDVCSEIITRALRRLDREVEKLNEDIMNEAISRSGLLQISTEIDGEMYVAGINDKQGISQACRKTAEAFDGYRYDVDDTVNSAPVFMGVIGGTATMVDQARIVNFEKTALKALCGIIKEKRMRVNVKDGAGSYKSENKTLIRVILAEIQESNVNLLAAWRMIPILKAQPRQIQFSETQSRAVYRKTRDEVKMMLQESRHIKARDDLGVIRSMKDEYFALAMPRYTRYQVNVKYTGLDKAGRGRKSMTVSLPILYSAERLKEPPRVSYPELDGSGEIRKRKARISEHPILESMSVHRYLEDKHAAA
jgi:hypothetical protein